eukprot:tig00000241_g21064.t1
MQLGRVLFTAGLPCAAPARRPSPLCWQPAPFAQPLRTVHAAPQLPTQRRRWCADHQQQPRVIRWTASAQASSESASVARDLENGRTLKQAAGWKTKSKPITEMPSSAAEIGTRFPRCVRIVDPKDFAYVYHRSRRRVGRLIIVDAVFNAGSGSEGGYAPVPSPFARVGVTVSRKYGKGHERVRFKRIVRAAFRNIQQELPPGLMFVVRPRMASKDAKSTDIAQEMKELLFNERGGSGPGQHAQQAAPYT